MLQSYKTKSVCVFDSGQFIELAVTLSKHFGRVYYHCPWRDGVPNSNLRMIGDDVPGLIKINNFFDIVDDTDLFVFPENFYGDLQTHLVSLGKRVWGSRHGDELELYRDDAKKYFAKVGLPVAPYEVVTGLTALRKYLKEHDNQYVKVNVTRGTTESFHAKTYRLIEAKLDELEHKIGAKKFTMDFIIEAAIDDVISEVGYDGFCIDGQFPSVSLVGPEIKDKAYVGKMVKYSELPDEVTGVNDALSDALEQYQYRNFMSTEIRITKDKTPYLIDLTQRSPSPPGEAYLLQWKNLPDILWYGAEGKCIDPEYDHKWVAILVVDSDRAEKGWLTVDFPKKYRENIKFRNLCMIGKDCWVVPKNVPWPEAASVVTQADSMEDAIALCKEIAKQIEGEGVEVCPEALDKAEVEIQKLRDALGMKL